MLPGKCEEVRMPNHEISGAARIIGNDQNHGALSEAKVDVGEMAPTRSAERSGPPPAMDETAAPWGRQRLASGQQRIDLGFPVGVHFIAEGKFLGGFSVSIVDFNKFIFEPLFGQSKDFPNRDIAFIGLFSIDVLNRLRRSSPKIPDHINFHHGSSKAIYHQPLPQLSAGRVDVLATGAAEMGDRAVGA